MNYQPLHLSSHLIRRLDEKLAAAIDAVDSEEAGKASVSLSFEVGRDKEGALLVVYTLKDGEAQKGELPVPARGQGRLPLDGDDTQVTIAAGGREVTMTAEQFGRAAEALAGDRR